MQSDLIYKSNKSHRSNWYRYLEEINTGSFNARFRRTLTRMLQFRDSKRFGIWIDTWAKMLSKTSRTQARDLYILPVHDNNTVSVHNGKSYVKVNCTKDKVGRRLGEFVETRVKTVHSTGKKK